MVTDRVIAERHLSERAKSHRNLQRREFSGARGATELDFSAREVGRADLEVSHRGDCRGERGAFEEAERQR